MWATGLAAALSAVAVASWLGPSPVGLVRRRTLRTDRTGTFWGRSRDRGTLVRLAAAAGACATAWFALHGRAHLVVLAFVAVLVGWAVVTLRERGRRTLRRRRLRTEMIELCDALAAELDTGAPPATALGHAAGDWPLLEPAVSAARLGGDVARSLRAVASTPGCEALAHVAAAWQVSHTAGAPLATTLDRLSSTLRDDQEARREVTASLGSPRATARLLAVLPLLGLALGAGMGGDPWAVLTESLLGAACLAVGASLAVTGVFWVERIADRAEVGP